MQCCDGLPGLFASLIRYSTTGCPMPRRIEAAFATFSSSLPPTSNHQIETPLCGPVSVGSFIVGPPCSGATAMVCQQLFPVVIAVSFGFPFA